MTLEFNDELHEYRFAGVKVPSVTQILRPLVDDRWYAGQGKRDIGTFVHEATALFDNDDLGELDAQLEPYLTAWCAFRDATGFRPLNVEHQVYHRTLGYAGTLDRFGHCNPHAPRAVFIDIKAGAPEAWHGVQLAAYAEAYGPFDGAPLRWGVYLKPDGSYSLREYNDPQDWQAFLACLALHRWKETHP